jgi:hypothetical protein
MLQTITSYLSAVGTVVLAVWTALHGRKISARLRRAEWRATEAESRAKRAEASAKPPRVS